MVEHGIQQIRHLDHYVDKLTTWLCGETPTGPFTIDAAAYGVRTVAGVSAGRRAAVEADPDDRALHHAPLRISDQPSRRDCTRLIRVINPPVFLISSAVTSTCSCPFSSVKITGSTISFISGCCRQNSGR